MAFPILFVPAKSEMLLVVGPPEAPIWSDDVHHAEWIGDRLSEFGTCVTSVVPSGFEAYARILHPAEVPQRGSGTLVRWSDIARWSGMALLPDAQFHSIALPPHIPQDPAPWNGGSPRRGTLYLPDAQALSTILRHWTADPEHCWFAIEWTQLYGKNPPTSRVRLPCNSYYLLSGPVEAISAMGPLVGRDHTANLWWPGDEKWCVATDDLSWTYVGGRTALIEELLLDPRLETLPAQPSDPLHRTEPWIEPWVDDAIEQVMATGQATISTARGIVHVSFDPSDDLGHRKLNMYGQRFRGVSSQGSLILNGDDPDWELQIMKQQLTNTFLMLSGG